MAYGGRDLADPLFPSPPFSNRLGGVITSYVRKYYRGAHGTYKKEEGDSIIIAQDRGWVEVYIY